MSKRIQKIPGMKLISDTNKTDGDGIPYRETKWRYGDRTIDVNIDDLGYHARIDDGSSSVRMDEGGLVGWLMRVLGRR